MKDDSIDVSDEDQCIPIKNYPDPVFRYDVQDEEAIIKWANESFRSDFGSSVAERSVQEWLNRAGFSANGMDIETISSLLAAGDSVDIEIVRDPHKDTVATTDCYFMRSVAVSPDQNGDGFIVLTSVPTGRNEADEVDWISSVLSHELRNPLDVAQAHLTAARESDDKEHLDKLQKAHNRMEQIIQDVLTLTRGQRSITPSDNVEVSEVANDAWTNVDTEGAKLEVSDDLPMIEADSERLKRLFENLFRNSVEHGMQDPVTGETPTTAAENGGEDSQIHIKVGPTREGFFVGDDGVGIPTEERDRIFEPGYSSRERGTGLGLTIVNQIAKAHGWSVRLNSRKGDGARFTFRVD